MQLSAEQRRDWLRLSRTEHVGPVTFRSLLSRFGSASAALEAVPDMARRGGGKAFVLPDLGEIDREIAQLEKMGGRVIASCESGYPRGLAALENAPPLISILGHPHLLQKEMVAIVGAQRQRPGAQIRRHLGARSGVCGPGGGIGPGAGHRCQRA